MLVLVREKLFEIETDRIEEVDNMKVKCTLCVRRDGAAVKTDNVYLMRINGKDCFVCPNCKAKLVTERRKDNGQEIGLSSN